MSASLINITAGLLLVLLLRRPARRLFGAGPAFALWLLPVLLAAMPWLPGLPTRWHLSRRSSSCPPCSWRPSAPRPAPPTRRGSRYGLSAAAWPCCVWCWPMRACAAAAAHCRPDLLASCRHDYPDLDVRRLRLHPQGPAVLWSWRSLILLPADLVTRFGAEQRALVLAHEQAHLARHDPLWSTLAEIAAALLWFHPLAWLALPRFRLDQELACDERVLRQRTHAAGSYARALLIGTGMDASPVLIPWLAEPQLKERLMMIRRERTSTPRRLAGYFGAAVFIGGLCLAAQASPLASRSEPQGHAGSAGQRTHAAALSQGLHQQQGAGHGGAEGPGASRRHGESGQLRSRRRAPPPRPT